MSVRPLLQFMTCLLGGASIIGCAPSVPEYGAAAVVSGALQGRTDAVTLTAASQLEPRRQQLRSIIWGSTSLPTAQATVHGLTYCNMTSFVPQFTGLQTGFPRELWVAMGPVDGSLNGLACLFVPTTANGRLVIYNPGHSNSVADGTDWSSDATAGYGDQRVIQALLLDGYSVLLTFMPQFRPGETGADHVAMFTNAAIKPAVGSVWQYFLGAVVGGLNYVQANSGVAGLPTYTEYDMLGLSGGGWTTTVYAAVDPRIKTSIQVAGSEPLDFWGADPQEEQTLHQLYDVAGYRDLYILGASGGRRQIQILNRHDNCCFFPGWGGSTTASNWGPLVRDYEKQVRTALVNMGDTGIFRAEIDEASVQHQVSRNAVANWILPELEGGRQHVAALDASAAFARGGNGDMWQWTSSGWTDTGLPIAGVPAIVANGQHAIDLFYRDPSNNLKQAWQANGSWTSQSLGGSILTSDPAAVSWAAGRIDIVAFSSDYTLHHWWISNNQVGSDVPSAAAVGVGTPSIVSSASNRLNVVFRNLSADASHTAGVTHVVWDGSSWTTESLGGQIYGLPSAAITTGPTVRVYALGRDQALYENAKVGALSWTGWASVSSAAGASSTKLGGSPRAVTQTTGVVMVQSRVFGSDTLAVFVRPSSWSFATAGTTTLQGSPTPLVSGGGWADSLTSRLELWNGTTWSDKGGTIE